MNKEQMDENLLKGLRISLIVSLGWLLKEVFGYVYAKIIVYSRNSQQISGSNMLKVSLPQVLCYVSDINDEENEPVLQGVPQGVLRKLVQTIWTFWIGFLLSIVIPGFILWEQLLEPFLIAQFDPKVILYQNTLPKIITLAQTISHILFISLIFAQSKLSSSKPTSLKTYQILVYSLAIILNPLFVSLYILKIIISLNNLSAQNLAKRLLSFIPLILTVLIIFLSLNPSLHPSLHPCKQFTPLQQYYSNILFPQTFSPQSNLIWIFYTHMFNRYLLMYQLIFFLLPISFSIPLALLQINYQTKLLVQYFALIFLSYHSSYFHLYLFWMISILCLPNFATYKNTTLLKINKTLSYVSFIGSIFFFFTYETLKNTYLTSWMVNIGYPFVFGCISWALIVIWLSQLIKIQLQEVANIPYQENDSKNPIDNLKEKLQSSLIKFKFWAKTHQSLQKNTTDPNDQKPQKTQ